MGKATKKRKKAAALPKPKRKNRTSALRPAPRPAPAEADEAADPLTTGVDESDVADAPEADPETEG